MSTNQTDKLPKTLVSETKGKHEQNCNDLRDYCPPTKVKIFKYNPDWGRKFNIGKPIKEQDPTYYEEPKFNAGHKKNTEK